MARPANHPPATEATFGAITVLLSGADSVILTRRGAPGRGPSRRSHIWGLDQIEAVAIAAEGRRGPEAQDEAKALRWAMAKIALADLRDMRRALEGQAQP